MTALRKACNVALASLWALATAWASGAKLVPVLVPQVGQTATAMTFLFLATRHSTSSGLAETASGTGHAT